MGRRTIVFVDEVHRFNKSQQDAFLPHVESGLFTFIGATTENPSFEVNSALLSRAAVYVLQPLSEDDLEQIVAAAAGDRCGAADRGEAARDRLIAYADGDARRLLNTLENAGGRRRKERAEVTDEWLLKVLGERMRRYDKGGDQFYDTISALHKSVRGSDPDASLYWFVRMLDGGVRPALHGPPPDPHGGRGHRAGRPARAAPGAGRGRGLRAAGLARGRAGAGRVPWSTWRWRPSPTRSTWPTTRPSARAQGRHPAGAAAPAQCAHQADEGPGTTASDYRYAHDEEGGFAAGENYFPKG